MFKTTEVFGAAQVTDKGSLTHVVEVVDGHMVRVLCKRVLLSNCMDDECVWTDDVPTCKACAKAAR